MGGARERGKYVEIWKKQSDGQWKAAEDIFNADAEPQTPPGSHVMVAPSAIKWGEAPPALPPGAKMAVVAGDPGKPAAYVIRAQLPAGYKIPAHWHPTDENITVLSGTVALGMGDAFDQAALQDLPVGGFTTVPAQMHHYFMSKTPSTIQVHGMGPFAITYINPAADPSKGKK